jgi:hypothetical protein
MWVRKITTEDVAKRGRVHNMAPSDPDGALKVARTIRHPWYRCQALSFVAEHTSTIPKKLKLLSEAFETARMQEEINRAVTVSAWPLRVLVPLDASQAKERLIELVAQADKELHSLRRADALYSLATAATGHETLISLVEPSLVRALLEGRGWRIDRLIRNTIQLRISHENTQRLLAHHGDGREKRKFLETMNAAV